ncbi:MAG: hypothetical protein CGW95_03825 [Phenylobacterium zucineum]|nr:MAG: hypothetical protein CGW95_03825 [Phenylobacterium zucineum]
MNSVRQERRRITLLFSDLTDSTGISAGLEPEQFADLLEQIRTIAHRVIPRHGGEIVRLDGDGMLCLFGFPEPQEDAGRRATEAALDLHDAISSHDMSQALGDRHLRLHSGIHAGLVLLRGGDIVRGKYEVLGDATNIAARLCDAAAPGEILVSTETLGGDQHFFLTGPLRAIKLNGRSAPVSSLPVKSRAGLNRRYEARERAGLVPFQGRTDELHTVRDWLSRSSADPVILGLHGPAGIGKSRFLVELTKVASEQGWRVVQGYCESYLSARPLQPLRQIATALRGEQARKTTSDVEILTADALTETVSGERILMVIDDWQWADDATRDLLNALLRRINPSQFRCVLASRVDDFGALGPASLTPLALAPFDRDTTTVTIGQILAAPDPFVIDQIQQASGGSPLLIEELCHAVTAGGDAPGSDLRGAWFDQAVQARFDRLEAHDQDFLNRSAVIGYIVPIWLMDRLYGAPIDRDQLERLQALDFLFPGETFETFRFKHGLTRDALYAGIGRSERLRLHAQVFDTLEHAVPERGWAVLLDALAYHALASGNAEKGLPLGIAAGDAALSAGALDRAQGHYLASLEGLNGISQAEARRDAAWSLLNKFGLACIVDPSPDQLLVLERLQRELALYGTDRDLQRADYWMGSIAYGVGLGKRSVRHLQAARHRAQAGGREDDGRLIQTKLAHSLFASGRIAEAVEQFEVILPQLAHAKAAMNANFRPMPMRAMPSSMPNAETIVGPQSCLDRPKTFWIIRQVR